MLLLRQMTVYTTGQTVQRQVILRALSRTALSLAFSYQQVMTVLQQGDKRHSYKTLQIRKRFALFERAKKENSGCWFEDLLGKLVGEEGL